MTGVAHSHIHEAKTDEIITTVIMARVTDFFGFFVYAIASALVFPKLFFPMYEPLVATLISFAIFSIAFLARPLANLLSRWLQKRIGRAGKVIFALMVLGSSTVAIGLLPGYEQIGWMAPILLTVFRFLQGIGIGGSWDGLTLQLQNAAPAHRQGLYAMVPQLGGPIGFVIAASLFYVLTGFLTEEEFLTFGWRATFFAVMAVNIVSLFARLRLLNADLGVDPELVTSTPIVEVVSKQWRPILLSAFLPLASYTLFHMVTVFPLGVTLLFTENSISSILGIQALGGPLAVLSVIASGILADKLSRRIVVAVSTTLIALLCLAIGTLLTHPALFIIPGFVVLGLAYGQAGAIVPKRFVKKYRYSGTALATNLSWIIGAAFAPLAGLGLTALFGLWAASLYLLSGAAVSLIAIRVLSVTNEQTG